MIWINEEILALESFGGFIEEESALCMLSALSQLSLALASSKLQGTKSGGKS